MQVFIGMWVGNTIPALASHQDYYMYIHIAGSAFTLIMNFLSLYLFMSLATTATKKLHANMTRAIIRTKLSFFDITPNGTIVNKFTKDTESIDVAFMRQLISMSASF